MATVDELLDGVATDACADVHDILDIDPVLRRIILPDTELILGVETDIRSERKYFRCPKNLGDNIDVCTCTPRVIYTNANGETDWYTVTDLQDNGDYVIFSWLLDEKVTRYRGDVHFSVCFCRSDELGYLTNEWNTTDTVGVVLKGLEVFDPSDPTVAYDVIARTEAAADRAEAAAEAFALELDDTLTASGKAADAKATGDALTGKAPAGYVDGTTTLGVTADLVLDAHIIRAINDTPVGKQRYVTITVPGSGASIAAGTWLMRIFRATETSGIIDATHESGVRMQRTFNGKMNSVLPGAVTDGWTIEAESPGAVSTGKPAALMADGVMRLIGNGDYAVALLHVPRSGTWSNYTVEADMTYRKGLTYAGLVYNATGAKLHQKAGIHKPGSVPQFFLNGRGGDNGKSAKWLNNVGGTNQGNATGCGALAVGRKFRLRVETSNMTGEATGSAKFSVAFYNGSTLGSWNTQATVDNIDASTWQGTIGWLLRSGLLIDVDNIKVTAADGTTLYSEDFSEYNGTLSEWLPSGSSGAVHSVEYEFDVEPSSEVVIEHGLGDRIISATLHEQGIYDYEWSMVAWGYWGDPYLQYDSTTLRVGTLMDSTETKGYTVKAILWYK